MSIQQAISEYLDKYFKELDGAIPENIYEAVLEQVERPLLAEVLRQAGNNQCRATEFLGLARGTVLKKLKQYGLIKPKPRRNAKEVEFQEAI